MAFNDVIRGLKETEQQLVKQLESVRGAISSIAARSWPSFADVRYQPPWDERALTLKSTPAERTLPSWCGRASTTGIA